MERNFPTINKMLIFTLFLFTASSMFSISISQITAGVGGFLWLLRTYLTNTWKEQRWPLRVPVLLFALASLVAVANAYDISYSYKPLKKLLEFLIFFWVLNCVRENNLRNSLLLVLIASATIASIFGIYQVWQAPVLDYTRAEGTLSTYMTFAGLLMMVEVLALAYVIFYQSTQKWVWASIGIIFYCFLITLTRQAWLGLFVGILFLIFFWRKKFFLYLPLLLIAIFLLSPDTVKTRILETTSPCLTFKECVELQEDELISNKKDKDKDEVNLKDLNDDKASKQVNWSLAMRTNLWQFGWKVFKDYPLTGCGFRCVDLVHTQYIDPFPQRHGSVRYHRGMHNNFIQIAVDTGILGLATWLGIWACFFRLLYRKATNLKPDSSERWIILGSAATVIAFLMGGTFETNFYDSEIAMLLYFIIALPFSGDKNNHKTVIKT